MQASASSKLRSSPDAGETATAPAVDASAPPGGDASLERPVDGAVAGASVERIQEAVLLGTKPSALLRLRFLIEFAVTWPIIGFFRLLPERLAMGLLDRLADVLSRVLVVRRRVGLANLALALPELSDAERKRILRGSFRSVARTFLELARMLDLDDDEIRGRVSYSPGSLEVIEANPGAILFTGHIGNWEMSAVGHSLHGHPFMIVVRRLENPHFNSRVQKTRTRGGSIVVERGQDDAGIRALMEHVQRGGNVGLLIDQYATKRDAIEAEFFGVRAWCHRGPALLALRTRAPLLPSFIHRDPERPGCYVITVRPPIEVAGGGGIHRRLRAVTQAMQSVMEAEIRSRPEEWLWTHRRWKRSPDVPDDLYPLPRRRQLRKRGSKPDADPE